MKARVKGTTNIIEVEFSPGALNACYPPYYDRENDMYYQPEQLVWVDNDNEGSAEPDYWTRLKHQAAIAAMQGIMMNEQLQKELNHALGKNEFLEDIISELATDIAHALVEKYKEKEERR